MVEIIEHSDEELRLNELTDSDDPRHLDGKFVFFLDSVGDEELADRFFEGNTEGNDMSRLERRRVEFQGIYNKSRIVEKAIRQDVVLVSELLGEKSGDKGLIDRAIEASPGGLGEIAKTSGGKKFIEDTIVLNLEIIAIENPSVFKQLERAIDEINKAVSKFREREKELFNLCDECSISGDVLIESFKKDPKTRNREIGQAIWDASKRLDEGQRKKLDSLDKKEDLERLRDEIDKALNVLARAIASAKNTEAVKDNVKKSVAESEKEDTSAEEEEDEESEEELESDTVEYAEDKVEKKEWFRNKFAIESTSSGNVWVASIFDKDENGRMKTVKCIVEEESIKSMQKDGQYMLPGVEYYFEPSHEKSKKKGEKGKKKESKSTDGRYDLLRYVKIRKPYPKEA
ncbi:MAG: hypothetical protein HQ538_00410, partial [Parcubacteria group bacterium]|nr:hypothetical protein [Parcubacteria group bacterium]